MAKQVENVQAVPLSGNTANKAPKQRSVFRTFSDSKEPDHNDFLETATWRKLKTTLDLEDLETGANGGSYAVVGPRGSGKSWLIRQAIKVAQERGWIGKWYPSPSDYHAEPFLASLTYSLADEVLEHLLETRRRLTYRVAAGLWPAIPG